MHTNVENGPTCIGSVATALTYTAALASNPGLAAVGVGSDARSSYTKKMLKREQVSMQLMTHLDSSRVSLIKQDFEVR